MSKLLSDITSDIYVIDVGRKASRTAYDSLNVQLSKSLWLGRARPSGFSAGVTVQTESYSFVVFSQLNTLQGWRFATGEGGFYTRRVNVTEVGSMLRTVRSPCLAAYLKAVVF
eukprot:jgi/Botrbrau1/6164/Bobra.0344s0005.1